MKRFLVLCFLITGSPLLAQQAENPFHNQSGLAAASSIHFKTDTSRQASVQKKSPGLALFMSLVLPGSGEYYAGSKQFTPWFMVSEALLWLGMYANNAYAANLADEYKSYAATHASVRVAGKDWQYWTNIGKYDDIFSYNEQRRRQRLFDDVYEENQANYWLWDSYKNRITYDGKRINANEAAARVIYFQAAVALNHLVSAVHAMYRARMHNKQKESSASWNLLFDTGYSRYAYRANLTIRF